MPARFRRPGLIPFLFVMCSVSLFVGLGAWQLQRLEQKETLLSRMHEAQSQPALGLLPTDDTALSADAYRSVALTGRYAGPETTLRFIGRASNGYLLYTPFKLEDSDAVVLVNRGFTPNQAALPAPPEGVQTVIGFLRPLRGKRFFSPENYPDKNLWFVEDREAMERATGMKLLPAVVEPEALPPVRNDHLGYAITWFLLAAVSVVMLAFYSREKA